MGKTIHSAAHRQLCDALRQLRLDAGLTQAQLAQRLKKPQSYVSKFEAGERRLDLLEVREICRAVEVPFLKFAKDLERLLG